MDTGALFKFVPVAALVAGAAAAGSYFGWGPYGMMQPKPPVCAAGQTCVIVAGIDGDVVVGPGAGDQPMGFDINDEATTRLAVWLERAAPVGSNVQAYKYPAEIEVPPLGVQADPNIGRNALRRAREIGAQYHARLVVIGTLSGNSVAVAFINPASTYPNLSHEQLGIYDISSVEWPERFQADYEAALLATTSVANNNTVVLPLPIPAGRRTPTPPTEPEVTPVTPATTEPAAFETPETTTAPISIVAATYTPPLARFLNEAYPERAYTRGMSATVHLRCRVLISGALADCQSTDSGPDLGRFRPAAITLAQEHMSGTPQMNDGVAVDTGQVEFDIAFPRRRN
ncbi:MAG: energy transducer TonB [Terricaulis sp.]